MIKKNGSWFADWHDVTGRRLRKAFKHRRDAERYQKKIRAETKAVKKSNASQRLYQAAALSRLELGIANIQLAVRELLAVLGDKVERSSTKSVPDTRVEVDEHMFAWMK